MTESENSLATPLNASASTTDRRALDLLEHGRSITLLHPSQDVWPRGVLHYGVQVRDELVLVASTGELLLPDQLPSDLALRHRAPGPSSLSHEAALLWGRRCERIPLAQALEALRTYFLRYVSLPDLRHALLLAAWSLASWAFRLFSKFPYLVLRSSERRCGKTRVLYLLSKVAFNSFPVTASPTEALLFRAAAQTGGTQIFDELEYLHGDHEQFSHLISVLNVGFERGAVVYRYERRGDRFVQVPYEVYVPRALAAIAPLKETLADRSLPLFMLRKRRGDRLERIAPGFDAEAAALRDQCGLATLGNFCSLVDGYEVAQEMLAAESAVDDRAADLWAPLLTVVWVADLDDGGRRTDELLGLARAVARVRSEDSLDTRTLELVEALMQVRVGYGERIPPTALLERLREAGITWIRSPRHLASVLQPLGLFAGSTTIQGQSGVRAYTLTNEILEDLWGRFAPPAGGDAEPS